MKSPFENYAQHNQDSYGDDNGILRHMKSVWTDTQPIFQEYWQQAELDMRFKTGDADAWSQVYGCPKYANGSQYQINWLLRLVNQLSGMQRENRKSTVVLPADNANDSVERRKTATQLSKTVRWVKDRDRTHFKFSDGFEQSAVTGLNLMGVYIDYSGWDPVNGVISTQNIGYSGFLLDPYFKDLSLSDCEHIWVRKFLKKNQILSILPNKEHLINEIKPISGNDSKFIYMPENYNNPQGCLYAYDEFCYRDTRKARFIVDTQSGETIEWDGDEVQFQYFKQLFPSVDLIDTRVNTVKLCCVVNDHVIYNGRHPLEIDTYPYVLMNTYFNPLSVNFGSRFSGIIRGLRDVQFLYNHRKIIEYKTLESQVNSGYIVKEGSLVDKNDLFKVGTGQIILRKSTSNPEDIQKIAPGALPESVLALSAQLAQDIPALAGITENAMGLDAGDKSGLQTVLRQSAGKTNLMPILDKLDATQMQLDSIILAVIQKNFSVGKIRQIIGEEPTEEFFSKSFRKYDCVVEEGAYTVNQKQLKFMQYVALKDLGVDVPAKFLIKEAPLVDSNDLLQYNEDIEKQQREMAQKQAEIEMQQQMLNTQLTEAVIYEKKGLGAERFSRIEENRALAVEKIEEAKKDNSTATLNLIKGAKELIDVDLNQLEKFFGIVREWQAIAASQDIEQMQGGNNVQTKTSPEINQEKPADDAVGQIYQSSGGISPAAGDAATRIIPGSLSAN